MSKPASSSEEASKPGVTSSYSKRANRGYNPKYEQSAFVSFGALCGSKRKNPEPPSKTEVPQRVSARAALNLSKEESKSSHQHSLAKVEEARDELLEEGSEDLDSEEEEEVFSDDEDDEEDDDEESDGEVTFRRRNL